MALDFDVFPYYDDSASEGGAIDNNYMRILFRPGYAVQARELTALQSILQNQISTLSGFVFQNGSPVTGGHISLDTTVFAVQLQSQFSNTDISLSDFLVNGEPTLVLNSFGNVKAYVVATDSSQINPTILVKYLTAAQFANSDTVQVATGLQTQASVFNSQTYTNPASVVSINPGVFYSGGFFVQVPAQTITLDSTTDEPTMKIGLSISELIVDEITDTALLDPAQGSFNYQAPGATRYQYALNLDKRTLSSTDTSAFYELLRVESGLITKQIDYPVFADLDKALAQRTFDTSGDFTVTPFIVSTQDNPANTAQYYLVVEPGKAYVKGFEFETIGTQKLVADKARSTNSVTDYGMSLDYGNYLVAQNVAGGNISGIFDITQFQSVDLQIVSSGSINTIASAAYAQTVIGTARVRDLEFLGLGNYFVYLTEIAMSPKSFISGSNVTISQVQFTNALGSAPTANIYANVIISVNTAGVTDTRTIVRSLADGTLILNQVLSVTPTTASNCSLVFAIKDINSGVIKPNTFGANVFFTQGSTTGDYACFDVGISGKNASGNTILNDTQFDKLIYPLPQNYVAQGTIVNASFETRKNLWSQTFTSGTITISSGSGLGTGESFNYGYTGALPAIVANNNVMVVVRNGMSSGLANGSILNFGVGNVVTEIDSTHLTIASNGSATFIGDIIITVEVTNASTSAVARRTKTLVGNSAQTFIQTAASNTVATQVIGSTPANTVYVDTANGYIWFTSNAAMAMTPGANQSLFVPDVFNILRVLDSGNTAWAPANGNVLTDIDITQNYYLNSGQDDNFYNFSSIILKPGANPPTGQTVVICQYFQHDTIGSPVLGFFDADSYNNALAPPLSGNVYSLGLIPYYASQNFGTISLRDSIDFRPTRTIGVSANVNNFNLNGLKTPYPDASMVLSFGYYLSRIDKLMLSKDKVFRISEGVPAQYPSPPSDADDAMTLYVVTLPAYTGNVFQINLQYVEHKRYTMHDIGVLDTRIQALEIQSSLSALEQQATDEKILYQDGVTAKDSYGIIADDFGSYSICNNQDFDLRCYMSQGSLTPYKDQHVFALNFAANSGAYNQDGKCYTLPFTEVVAVQQNAATTFVSVQPFLFAQFKGTTTLNPETTTNFSANLAPAIIAPPATAAPEQPPAPAPTPAPALAVKAPIQEVITIVSTREIVEDFNDYWDYWDYRGGFRYYIRVPRYVIGYGAVNYFYNWYGVATVTVVTTTAVTTIPNSGSTIQLAAATASSPAPAAAGGGGGIHLFGAGGVKAD
jgi:Domain of unknown function (DUF4815)